jgi:hypothetical protein
LAALVRDYTDFAVDRVMLASVATAHGDSMARVSFDFVLPFLKLIIK